MNENVKFMQHTTGATGAPLYYWCDWSSSILLVRLELCNILLVRLELCNILLVRLELLYTTGTTGATGAPLVQIMREKFIKINIAVQSMI